MPPLHSRPCRTGSRLGLAAVARQDAAIAMQVGPGIGTLAAPPRGWRWMDTARISPRWLGKPSVSGGGGGQKRHAQGDVRFSPWPMSTRRGAPGAGVIFIARSSGCARHQGGPHFAARSVEVTSALRDVSGHRFPGNRWVAIHSRYCFPCSESSGSMLGNRHLRIAF